LFGYEIFWEKKKSGWELRKGERELVKKLKFFKLFSFREAENKLEKKSEYILQRIFFIYFYIEQNKA